jgi:hypothetical protein
LIDSSVNPVYTRLQQEPEGREDPSRERQQRDHEQADLLRIDGGTTRRERAAAKALPDAVRLRGCVDFGTVLIVVAVVAVLVAAIS